MCDSRDRDMKDRGNTTRDTARRDIKREDRHVITRRNTNVFFQYEAFRYSVNSKLNDMISVTMAQCQGSALLVFFK